MGLKSVAVEHFNKYETSYVIAANIIAVAYLLDYAATRDVFVDVEIYVAEYWLFGFPAALIIYILVTYSVARLFEKRNGEHTARLTAAAVGVDLESYRDAMRTYYEDETTWEQCLRCQQDRLKQADHVVSILSDNTFLMRLNTGFDVVSTCFQWLRLILIPIAYLGALYHAVFESNTNITLGILWMILVCQLITWLIAFMWAVICKWITGYVPGICKNTKMAIVEQSEAKKRVAYLQGRIDSLEEYSGT